MKGALIFNDVKVRGFWMSKWNIHHQKGIKSFSNFDSGLTREILDHKEVFSSETWILARESLTLPRPFVL